MTIELKILPVFQGDAIMINCIEDDFRILIDIGTKRAYSRGILKSEIEKTNKFDLLVLTHTDEDHIGGLIKFLVDKERKQNVFKMIWFNNGEIINSNITQSNTQIPEIIIDEQENLELSVKQGISLEKSLKNIGLAPKEIIKAGRTFQFGNIKIIILSPEISDLENFLAAWDLEKEKQLQMSKASDYDKPISELLKIKYIENGTLANKTSIAFILYYNKKSILLMGDAYPSVIETNLRKIGYSELNKCKLDFVKVSHHGSTYGISPTLLGIIDCKDFIISTNGSNGLPFKECLARIVAHRKETVILHFNYKNEITQNIFSLQDFSDFNFELKYLTKKNDYTIKISD
jgi:beta-lactamase superfamily II metal-dependent hydrolase